MMPLLSPNSFSYPSLLGPIITAAAASPVAASRFSNDTIQLYDLAFSASLGALRHHTASITSLSFFTLPSFFPHNLLSAAADGSISVFDADPFVQLKTIRAHKKGVNDLDVHPSGKLALTVGKDEHLAMMSFFCWLSKKAGLVMFDLSGERFLMVTKQKVGVHDAEDARLVAELECQRQFFALLPERMHLYLLAVTIGISQHEIQIAGGAPTVLRMHILPTSKAWLCLRGMVMLKLIIHICWQLHHRMRSYVFGIFAWP